MRTDAGLYGWLDVMRRRMMVLCAALMIVAMVGCRSDGGGGSTPAEPVATAGPTVVDELKLFTSPSALNLDSEPGADGFAAKVYALRRDSVKAVPIEQGRLELLIYEGVVTLPLQEGVVLHRMFTYVPRQLAETMYRSVAGVDYRFALTWDKATLKSTDVTVIARYVPSGGGKAVWSAPVSLNVTRRAGTP